jgi:hypothetical protein
LSAGFDHHIPKQILDQWDMLSEQDCAWWEEHLLVCNICQDRLARADECIRVVRSTAVGISIEPSGFHRLLAIELRITRSHFVYSFEIQLAASCPDERVLSVLPTSWAMMTWTVSS